MKNPTDLKYSNSHEWVRLEGDGTASIGITDHAQAELGDITFLELPELGTVISFDEPFGTVESVKAVSDLVAPLSGEVIKTNDILVDAPEAINDDPYGCWMVVVKIADKSEVESLMSAEQYEAFTEEG